MAKLEAVRWSACDLVALDKRPRCKDLEHVGSVVSRCPGGSLDGGPERGVRRAPARLRLVEPRAP